MFKFNNKAKTLTRRPSRRSIVFIVNFEHVIYFFGVSFVDVEWVIVCPIFHQNILEPNVLVHMPIFRQSL